MKWLYGPAETGPAAGSLPALCVGAGAGSPLPTPPSGPKQPVTSEREATPNQGRRNKGVPFGGATPTRAGPRVRRERAVALQFSSASLRRRVPSAQDRTQGRSYAPPLSACSIAATKRGSSGLTLGSK